MVAAPRHWLSRQGAAAALPIGALSTRRGPHPIGSAALITQRDASGACSRRGTNEEGAQGQPAASSRAKSCGVANEERAGAGLSAAGSGGDGRVLKQPSTAAAGFPRSRGAMAAAGPGLGPGAGGTVKTLALVLEDEARRGGYCSGDTVSGQVLLELAGPLPLRGLRLEAAGRARVAWSESSGAVPGAGTWGVAARAPGPRREAEVRYLDIRQSLLRDPPEGEGRPGGVRGRVGAPWGRFPWGEVSRAAAATAGVGPGALAPPPRWKAAGSGCGAEPPCSPGEADGPWAPAAGRRPRQLFPERLRVKPPRRRNPRRSWALRKGVRPRWVPGQRGQRSRSGSAGRCVPRAGWLHLHRSIFCAKTAEKRRRRSAATPGVGLSRKLALLRMTSGTGALVVLCKQRLGSCLWKSREAAGLLLPWLEDSLSQRSPAGSCVTQMLRHYGSVEKAKWHFIL